MSAHAIQEKMAERHKTGVRSALRVPVTSDNVLLLLALYQRLAS